MNRPQASKPAAAGLVITMDSGASDRETAQQQLAIAERDLNRVRPAALSAEEAKTYRVAWRFEQEGEAAMLQKRYLIATGLARKAKSLAHSLAYQQEISQRTSEAANAFSVLKAKLLGHSDSAEGAASRTPPMPESHY